MAISMALRGATKLEILRKISDNYYPLDFRIDDIRETYRFNETCQATVPQAIEAFLESISFEDAIRTAISVGGDSDTLAAITGGIAEAYYGIPKGLRDKAVTYLDAELRAVLDEWTAFIGEDGTKDQFRVLTKYVGKLSLVKSFGDWVIDRDNNRTSDHPIQLPYVGYSELVTAFTDDFYQFADSHPEYELASYKATLEKNGLAWDSEAMCNADVDVLDAQGILALLMGAVRAERFCDGILLDFFKDSFISKWLRRLKDIDDVGG